MEEQARSQGVSTASILNVIEIKTETRQQRWRRNHPDRYRTYMREYYRKRKLNDSDDLSDLILKND